ncbi:LacI family DNA-binding transcriptional regulator [Peribacillus kribbensis]|uniref:LacI family DNA-binding transcriptional regulator n=1 Tax=Peribacillus kribbensis TaxID=356658 RepID=UPI0004182119|nr:LacI family DNA-binding transcriptional regulator [Peribacillus kribbensis]
MTTIADVANLAGLSRATVSRVINNHPNVSEEKKRLVREAMDRLNYVPNSSAQKLRSQKTDTIAILVPVLTNPFFAYLLEAMDEVATENNLQLLVCQTRYDKEKEHNYLKLLMTKQVDGLILTSCENDWNSLAEYAKYGPMILCNESSEQVPVPAVRLDHEKAAFDACCHLIEQGCRRIAFTYGDTVSSVTLGREAGYKSALSHHGIPLCEDLLVSQVYNLEDGRKAFNYFTSLKERPDGIFTGSDQVATGIIMEAKANNINIPDDLAIIGFDDQPIATVVEPALTTIRQPIKEMGKKAMEMLIEAIGQKETLTYQEILLPYELMIRDSSKFKIN